MGINTLELPIYRNATLYLPILSKVVAPLNGISWLSISEKSSYHEVWSLSKTCLIKNFPHPHNKFCKNVTILSNWHNHIVTDRMSPNTVYKPSRPNFFLGLAHYHLRFPYLCVIISSHKQLLPSTSFVVPMSIHISRPMNIYMDLWLQCPSNVTTWHTNRYPPPYQPMSLLEIPYYSRILPQPCY